MSETIKPPWWFWVISVLAVLWNFVGPMDFYNSVTLNEEYLSQFPGMYEFVRDMPMWAKIPWGIAVFSAFLGSVLLLLRRKLAFTVYVIALIGMVISFGYQWTAPNKVDVPGWVHLFTVIIWIIAIFLTWFSKHMKGRGILT